jgi:hypothetical protein
MPISNDLFLAILSMDSYNRGYNAGVRGLTGTSSSNAKLGRATNADTEPNAFDVSFFTRFYTLDAKTIISNC